MAQVYTFVNKLTSQIYHDCSLSILSIVSDFQALLVYHKVHYIV